jgi:hypothetical protein
MRSLQGSSSRCMGAEWGVAACAVLYLALSSHTDHAPPPLHPPQVQWQGKGPESATWLTRDDLCDMGLEKMVTDLDMKEAARAVSDCGCGPCIWARA